MKYYVYYNYGSCNDGDHDNGLDQYETKEQAEARLKELRDRITDEYLIAVVIEGVDITLDLKRISDVPKDTSTIH